MTLHWRYVLWVIWSNLITLLQVLQLAVAALMISSEVFTHTQFRVIVIVNALLSAFVAQIKRNKPPGPAPRRDDADKHDPVTDP
jgi:hypothetical protein